MFRCDMIMQAVIGPRRRGGRVAEGARLESVYAGDRIGGSNPPPSANILFHSCPVERNNYLLYMI